MPVITKRPRARDDLAEIWDYIADDSEARADAFIDTVNGKFRTLAGQRRWAARGMRPRAPRRIINGDATDRRISTRSRPI
ncbi:MAG: type II toxin-antitoxin system RelE/ParE family toxin [Gammaproteobacteria bacterium]